MDDVVLLALRQLAERQHGAFRWGQAIELGVTMSDAETAIRRQDWHRLRHGVYALKEEVERRQRDVRAMYRLRCAAEQLALGFDPVFSHEWSAAVQGMHHLGPMSDRPVVSREPHRVGERSERKGLFVVSLPQEHRITAEGIPLTSPARTAVDLARRDGVLAGVVAADAALWGGSAYQDLEAVAAHCWHWPGGASGRAAVALARDGAQSALESIGRVAFVDHDVPEPELQLEVWRWGRLIAILDQAWRGLLLAAEADGAVKYTELGRPRTVYEEKRRQEGIEDCGIAVVRYDWDDAWRRPRELAARWHARAATAWQRSLAPGVTLRARRVRRAA